MIQLQTLLDEAPGERNNPIILGGGGGGGGG
eukprot:COSAG02_NODE_34017_length_490_cov_17.081494_1_plen_30_part_01